MTAEGGGPIAGSQAVWVPECRRCCWHFRERASAINGVARAAAKEKGAKVIVITNLKHTQSVNSRHPSGKRLFEIADLYFDNGGEIGDASVALEGLDFKVGATSTSTGAVILQSIMVQAAENLIQRGIVPEIFSSSNSDEGEEHNENLIVKYKGKIKGL